MSDPLALPSRSAPISAHPSARASGVAGQIAWLGLAGVTVLLASVALAVGGPMLNLPGLQADARAWAVGSVLLGGLGLLQVLRGLMLRQLGQLHRRALSLPTSGAVPVESWPQGHGRAAEVAAVMQRLLDERGVAEQARLRLQAQLQALALAVPQGVALTRERRFDWANPTFCEQLGWAPGELLGRSPYELFSSVNADDRLGVAVRTAFAAGQPYVGELDFRRRDGSRFTGRLQARQIRPSEPAAGTLWQLDALHDPPNPGKHGEPMNRPVENFAPAVAVAVACATPTQGANRDPLTRFLDRPAFEAALAAWLARAPANQPATLLYLDLPLNLDHFGHFKDTAGSATATLLRAVAQRLRHQLAALAAGHEDPGLRLTAAVGVAEINRRDPVSASDWLARGHAAWQVAKYGGQDAVRLGAPQAREALTLPV